MKTILIAVIICTTYIANAQNYVDATMLSETDITGDARYTAMAGAFGALGGNLTASQSNPAGLGVFRENTCELSLNYRNSLNTTNYLQTNNAGTKTNNFVFNNIGFNSAYKTGKNDLKVKYINFSITMNKEAINNSSNLFSSINDHNSYSDDILNRAYWHGADDDYVYVAEPTELLYYENNQYYTDFRPYDSTGAVYSFYGQNQKFNITKEGRKNSYNFSFGTNINDKVYFGLGFKLSNIRYRNTFETEETDPYDNIPNLKNFTLIDIIDVSSTGVGASIGIIAKPVEFMRLGLAYHTPEIQNMTYKHTIDLTTQMSFLNDPLHERTSSEYNNKFASPSRVIGSLGFVYKNYASLNIDYEYKDYSSAYYYANDYDFLIENAEINNKLIQSHTIRIGGELWAGAYGFRAGFANETSPFADNLFYTTNKNSYSAGLGIRVDNIFMDFGLIRTMYSYDEYLYSDFSDNAVLANTDRAITQAIATIGFKL